MEGEDDVEVALVALSDPLKDLSFLDSLVPFLEKKGGHVTIGRSVYEETGGMAKADEVNSFFRDKSVKRIYDISGGDIANECLKFLDFESIASSNAMFYGYSDLTTVINAILKTTGKKSVLMQIRNIALSEKRRKEFFSDENSLFTFHHRFVQGEYMDGTIVGGNVRCLLKLMGTEYFPDTDGKILFLEAMSGKKEKIVTYFSQLDEAGIFGKVRGILLGTFLELEKDGETVEEILLKRDFNVRVPVAVTSEIGHGKDSKALLIGGNYTIEEGNLPFMA